MSRTKIKKTRRERELFENWQQALRAAKRMHAALVGVWATGYVQREPFDLEAFADLGEAALKAGVRPFTSEEE